MQFVVIGLDGSDKEAKSRRQAARPDHLKRGDELIDSGNLWYAAALLNDDGSMKGSVYIVNFPNKAALQAWLDTEPYVVGEVWKYISIHKSNTRDPWQFNHSKNWFKEQK